MIGDAMPYSCDSSFFNSDHSRNFFYDSNLGDFEFCFDDSENGEFDDFCCDRYYGSREGKHHVALSRSRSVASR